MIQKMKPILFNAEMVRAILDGRKTVTRRKVLLPNYGYFIHEPPRCVPPYRAGDILYVRETFAQVAAHTYWYRADSPVQNILWRPSIHMPKEAARIFLRVTAVRVERLREITVEDAAKEGCKNPMRFDELWNSTIKPADLPKYGWEANPWVWVIEFERISKEEALNNAN